jgi:hypothetical protein
MRSLFFQHSQLCPLSHTEIGNSTPYQIIDIETNELIDVATILGIETASKVVTGGIKNIDTNHILDIDTIFHR